MFQIDEALSQTFAEFNRVGIGKRKARFNRAIFLPTTGVAVSSAVFASLRDTLLSMPNVRITAASLNQTPFDWEGKHWSAKRVIAEPKPLTKGALPMATASETEATQKLAGELGIILLSAFLEPIPLIKNKIANYEEGAKRSGRSTPRETICASRAVYLADSKAQAIEDLRASVAFEVSVQEQRGFVGGAGEGVFVDFLLVRPHVGHVGEGEQRDAVGLHAGHGFVIKHHDQ